MNTINKVKEIPIIAVVKKYLPDLELTEYQYYANGICPFHKDCNPSFTVYTDTNTWQCFGCGRRGSNIDLVMQIKGMDVWEATKELAGAWDIPFEEFTPEQQAKHEEFIIKQELLGKYITWAHAQLKEEHREALHNRGMTDEIIDKYKIGFDPGNNPTEEAEMLGFIGNGGGYLPGGRIVIPAFHYDKPIYAIFWDYSHTADSKTPKYILPQGWGKPLVGIDRIRNDKPVYVVEGIFDWFPMIMSGYPTVCAIGTSVSKEKQARLKRAQRIFLLLDNDSQKEDNPGQKAALTLLKEMFPKAKNVVLPDGKDPNDIYMENTSGFKALIDQLTGEAKDTAQLVLDKLEQIPDIKSADYTEVIEPLKKEYTDLAAQLDSETQKDIFIEQLYLKLKPAGVTKKSIQKEMDISVKAKRIADGEDERESQHDTLLKLSGDSDLFKDEFNEPFAKLEVDGHSEIWSVEGRAFARWLTYKFYTETGRGPSGDALSTAINTISARAIFDGHGEFKLNNRTAEHGEAFWYDLSDEEWRAVRMTPDGWDIVQDTPILFRRYSHMKAQPEPVREGDINRLLEFINLKDENAKILYLTTVVASFIPDIAHAIFVFHGSEGTGKSLASKVTRRIIDPSASETCNNYDKRDEFVQHMAHNYMIVLDNLTGMGKKLSDMICAAVTGDGSSKRALYTDDDDKIYNFKRLFIINGINNAATEADLLRRSVLFQLEQIPSEKRMEERIFWEKFNEAKSYILGGVFDALSKAMKIYPQVKLKGTYSLADYTVWGYAIAEALGFGGDAFLEAYKENQGIQTDEAITNHPVAMAITLLMGTVKEWKGKASELLNKLVEIAGQEINTGAKNWPRSANALARKLNEVQTVLSKKGIEISNSRSGSGRIITIRLTEDVIAVTSATNQEKQDAQGDSIPAERIPLFNARPIKREDDWSTVN